MRFPAVQQASPSALSSGSWFPHFREHPPGAYLPGVGSVRGTGPRLGHRCGSRFRWAHGACAGRVWGGPNLRGSREAPPPACRAHSVHPPQMCVNTFAHQFHINVIPTCTHRRCTPPLIHHPSLAPAARYSRTRQGTRTRHQLGDRAHTRDTRRCQATMRHTSAAAAGGGGGGYRHQRPTPSHHAIAADRVTPPSHATTLVNSG